MKTSNLESVKSMAINFLYQDIEETDYSPMLIIHPIFENGITAIKDNEGLKLVNILESEDNLRTAQGQIKQRILSATDIWEVYIIIRKSYRMTFLRYIKPFLSVEDMSKLLAHAWTTSENPNGDINVSLNMAIKWFEAADKTLLMDDDEYKVYQSLPDTLTIYRGVAVGRNPKGLSWTQNLKTANWFANRYNTERKKGYIQTATINRERVLAYFNSRDEDELVVDTRKLNVKKLK